jgi:hypothetical protein
MITIFTNPRPFTGHFKILQYNAIRSWGYLHPQVQIILFEDEEGTTLEVADTLNTQYVPDVPTNEFGTPLIDGVFARVQSLAIHEIVVQVNADIILTSTFIDAIERIQKVLNGNPFLMIGRRWDMDIDVELSFDEKGEWEKELLSHVKQEGSLHRISGMDYWTFRKDFNFDPPPFVVGRPGFDSWLIQKSKLSGIPVIDATDVITIIHQNHDYPQQRHEYYYTEKTRNVKLAGGFWSNYSLLDSDFLLNLQGLKRPTFPRRIFSLFSTNKIWQTLLGLYLVARKKLAK